MDPNESTIRILKSHLETANRELMDLREQFRGVQARLYAAEKKIKGLSGGAPGPR